MTTQTQFNETEFVKRLRETAKELSADSPFGKEVRRAVYEPWTRRKFTKGTGELDIEALSYTMKRTSYETQLIPFFIALNLSGQEADEAIKEFCRSCYRPEFWPNQDIGIPLARRGYETKCKLFGIGPDDGFPDWGNWREAIANGRGIEELLEK